MLNRLFPISVLLLASSFIIAQSTIPAAPHIDERCGTVHMHEWRQQHFGAESEADFEEWMSRKMKDMDFSQRGIITIPTVVHVIHSGEPVGSLPNISTSQVLSQMTALNEDFRKTLGSNGYNNHPAGADVEVEFCLAQLDPQGLPTNGINRVDLGVDTWDSGSADGQMKPNTIWNPNEYFNVWVCNLSPGLLGYAQFPSSSGLPGLGGGAANTDGVVIGAEFFGSIDLDDGTFIMDDTYNLGRTLTHEAGHFFGLRHIWGDGGCNQDDYCNDTPAAGGSNGGCPSGTMSCDTEDMIENYMDYTADFCMNIFTNDQKARMLTVLANSPRRVGLLSSPACTTTPPFALSGQVVDAATGQGIPNAKLHVNGVVSLDLVTNANGNFTISDIYAGDYDVYVGSWGHETRLFEGMSFNANGTYTFELEREYYDDFYFDLGWSSTGNAETGSWVRGIPIGSQFDEFNYDPSDDLDNDIGLRCYLTGNSGGTAGSDDVDNGTTTLTSPSFDATLYLEPKVSFYRWFMTGGGQGATPDDILEISLSNGSTTMVVETVDINSPDLGEWVYKEFVIADYMAPTSNMTLILTTSDQVTSLEGHLVDAGIDVFRVSEASSTSVDNTLADELNFNMMPNPSDGWFDIRMNQTGKETNILVFDALGRQVAATNANDEITRMDISNQADGIYFVRIEVDGRSFVRKLIKG